MLRSVRAELTKQRHRPSSRLLLAVAAALTLTFAYVVPYAGYKGKSGAPGGLAPMLPAEFDANVLGGLPIFVGALALIFGVLVAGGEYGSDTWKAVLIQRPSRMTAYGAKLVTVAIGTLTGVLTLAAASAAASAIVAAVESQPMDWPGSAHIVAVIGAGWLVSLMWGSLGVLAGIGLRSVALPIGLGLVWLLAVQNLLASIAAPLLHWIAELQKVLPGPNAGSLAARLGASADAPGVSAIVGTGHALIVLGGYLVAFCAIGGWLLGRRDII